MKPRASVLRYQVRYAHGGEPETLIATDSADALQQARRRADLNKATVALWRDGALVAECRPSPDGDDGSRRTDLTARLVEAGVYIFTAPPQTDRHDTQKSEQKARR